MLIVPKVLCLECTEPCVERQFLRRGLDYRTQSISRLEYAKQRKLSFQ